MTELCLETSIIWLKIIPACKVLIRKHATRTSKFVHSEKKRPFIFSEWAVEAGCLSRKTKTNHFFAILSYESIFWNKVLKIWFCYALIIYSTIYFIESVSSHHVHHFSSLITILHYPFFFFFKEKNLGILNIVISLIL